MPTVPSLDVPTVSPQAPPTPNASAEAFGAGVGRAAQGLGEQLQRSSDAMFEIARERHEQRQGPEDALVKARYRLDMAEALRKDLNESQAEAVVGKGDYLQRRRQSSEQISQQVMKNLLAEGYRPSPKAITEIDVMKMGFQETHTAQAISTEDTLRRGKIVDGHTQNASRIMAMAIESGGTAQASALIDEELEGARAVLPVEDYKRFEGEIRRQMGNTTIAVLTKVQEENIDGSATDEQLQALVTQGYAEVDSAVAKEYLDPAKGEELKQRFKEGILTRTLQAMTPTQRFKRTTGGSVDERIIQIESGGNPNARAGTSSATGLGQATSGTWNEFLEARHPNLVGAQTDYRLDPTLSREFVAWYREENTKFFERRGIPVTDGNIYLAHFLGPGGAAAMLNADPNKNAVSINPAAANSNKRIFYHKDGTAKTAGEIAAWAEEKMGAAPTGPFTELPGDVIANVRDQALIDLRQEDAAIEAAVAKRQSETADLFRYQVELAQAGEGPMPLVSDIQRGVEAGALNPGQGATIIQQMGLATEENKALARSLERVGSGDSFNPALSADKADINRAYNHLSEGAPASFTSEFIAQTKVVPDKVAAQIHQGLASPDIQLRAAAYSQAWEVHNATPFGTANALGGEKIRDAAVAFNTLVGKFGMSDEAAATRLMEMESEDWKAAKARLEARPEGGGDSPMDVFVKGLSINDVTTELETAAWNDEGGFTTVDDRLIAEGEYREFARQGLIKHRGDEELAKDYALDRMKEIWNVSNATGEPILMRFPPERSGYQPINGSYDYLNQELKNDIKSLVGDVPIEGLTLRAAAFPNGTGTADDIRRKRPAGYVVEFITTGEDGQRKWHVAPGIFTVRNDRQEQLRREAMEARIVEMREVQEETKNPPVAPIIDEDRIGLGVPEQ